MESLSHPGGPLYSPAATGRFEVPAISLAVSREETVDALRNAATASGFFQLVDIEFHVPRALIVQMFDETRRFFQLPPSEKQKVSRDLAWQMTW
jgi:isopenicillin N synthase-like dioxygenase